MALACGDARSLIAGAERARLRCFALRRSHPPASLSLLARRSLSPLSRAPTHDPRSRARSLLTWHSRFCGACRRTLSLSPLSPLSPRSLVSSSKPAPASRFSAAACNLTLFHLSPSACSRSAQAR
jgi:hypothetical protein